MTGSSTSAAGSTSRSRSWRWRPIPRPATRSRSGRCAAGGWRWSWSSSSTRCSACATAAGGCRGASIRRPTGRWAAACRRAWATWIRTSTGGAWTRCWRLFVGEPGGTPASRCSPTSTARCAPPPAEQQLRAGRVAAPARGAAAHDPRPPRRGAGGHPRAAAAGPGAASRRRPALEAFWLVGGRLVDFGPLAGAGRVEDLTARTEAALRRERAGRRARGPRPARRDRRGADPRHLAGLAPGHAAARAAPGAGPRRVQRVLGQARGGGAGDRPGGRQAANGSSTTTASTSSAPTSTSEPGRRLAADERQRDRPQRRRLGDAAQPADHAVAEGDLGAGSAPEPRAAGRAAAGWACRGRTAGRPSPGRRSSPW